MAFILGFIGTVILVVLVGSIGFAALVGTLVYFLLFAAGLLLFVALKLIVEGLGTEEYAAVAGGVGLLMLVIGLSVQFYKFAKKK